MPSQPETFAQVFLASRLLLLRRPITRFPFQHLQVYVELGCMGTHKEYIILLAKGNTYGKEPAHGAWVVSERLRRR